MNEWMNKKRDSRRHYYEYYEKVVVAASSSGASFFACFRIEASTKLKWLVKKRNFLLPTFLCAQIFIERETSGYKAVVVAGTSYQMKEVFINSILLSGEGLTFFSNRNNIFGEKKIKLSRVSLSQLRSVLSINRPSSSHCRTRHS